MVVTIATLHAVNFGVNVYDFNVPTIFERLDTVSTPNVEQKYCSTNTYPVLTLSHGAHRGQIIKFRVIDK
jgi:hypothetical protein